MSLILNEHYGFSISGFKGFWLNRFLRLYPAYFAACLMSIVVIMFIPSEYVTVKNSKLILPDSLFEFITNITIFGLQEKENQSSLVPPAWALSIEIFYYFLISIWAGKSKKNARLFLVLGVFYLFVVYLLKDFNWWYRYFVIGAGALPFAVGVNVYFQLASIKKAIEYFAWIRVFIFSLLLYIFCFIGAYFFRYQETLFFYLNIISTVFLLSSLWHFPDNTLKRVDSFFGDLSYPTYLVHWQVGITIAYVAGINWKSWELLLVSLIIVTGLSIIESKTISGPIERYRKMIKMNVNPANDGHSVMRIQYATEVNHEKKNSSEEDDPETVFKGIK